MGIRGHKIMEQKTNFISKIKNFISNRPKRIKNKAILKRGSYSIALTAAVIAGAIVLNVLVSVLADRFVLEYDMSTNKSNSISEENIDYIKSVKEDVSVILCADKESYVGGYMTYYSQQYNVNDENATPYYDQTIKLIERYGDYNKKIDVKFVDTQSTAFSQISATYPNETINYGDIIVSCEKDGVKRHKIIKYTDIYNLAEDSNYAAYGYTVYTVSSNNIETALTGAISYVTSNKTKKVAFLTGHSAKDYTADYKTLLEKNNYEITVVSDKIITSISNDFDALVIASPTVDFLETEIDAIENFLDNGGELNKGLMFFADITSPYLTNFYDFLEQWGISVGEGVVYETDETNHLPEDPTTIGLYSTKLDDITSDVTVCITGSNVPLMAAYDEQESIKVTPLIKTLDSTIAAPVGSGAGWTGAENYTKQSYASVIEARKTDYTEFNKKVQSYIIAFSSPDYIYSDYNSQSSVSNNKMTVAAAERVVGAEDAGILFLSKRIVNESFATEVTEASTNLIRIIFVISLPIICIVMGIYIYIKRRNA